MKTAAAAFTPLAYPTARIHALRPPIARFGSEATVAAPSTSPDGGELSPRIDSDFVPTPGWVVQKMIDGADIKPEMKVLEPSAGSGHIARELKKLPVDLSICEFNDDRRKQLADEGYKVVGADFMAHRGIYDRILMNPPFSKGQAIKHVQHAFSLLKPGGRLAAILPEYIFVSKNKPQWTFRSWYNEATGGRHKTEPLDESVFANGDSNVKVKTRILTLQKPTTAAMPTVPKKVHFGSNPFATPGTGKVINLFA